MTVIGISPANGNTRNHKALKIINNMRKHNTIGSHDNDIASLAEDAKALLAATSEMAEDKVVEARNRLSAALEKGRETWDGVREKVVDNAKAADGVIRDHPYQAIGVALGLGALFGYLLSRRD